jgi:transcription termination factor Rho
MSAESQQLERSALERKDRDELMTIATALGSKPPSRAKKADIVSLILELTGVTSGGEETPTADQPSEGGEQPGTTGSAEGPGEGSEAGARPARSRRTRRPKAESDAEAVDTPTAAEAPTDDTGPGESAGSGTSTSEAPADDAEVPAAAHAADPGGPTTTSEAGRPADGQTQAGNEQTTDGESSGRRRRRRGRDRGDRGERPERGERGERGERPDREESFSGEPQEAEGLLDLRDEGYGFIRVKGYLPSKDDVYVSVKQTRQFSLRPGDLIKGTSRPATRNEKNPALLRIESVNGVDVDTARGRRRFEDLTPLFPDERLRLESAASPYDMTARIIDLICPIGKGQRGLIVSPPKAGKTTIMKQIAKAIEANDPEVHLMVLLVDERPEEVTDMRRSVKGEVVASTFDRPVEEHTAVAELAIERAKRMVEEGKDVVVILDGVTRLARAYNLAAPGTGRVMSGGIDTAALYPPKKFFGAARNLEEGGSLTILATALVDTGSKMDEVIFEEFKGTGNMELRLDRRMAERRIYPAIDVDGSSTRHEELLFDRKQLQNVWKLRRVLSGLAAESGSGGAGLEMLIDRLGHFKTNEAFLDELGKA